MDCTSFNVFFIVSFVTHILGMASLALFRLAEKSALRFPCQAIFVVCMLVIALITMAQLSCGKSDWVLYCPVLALMIVGGTMDFSARPRRPRY